MRYLLIILSLLSFSFSQSNNYWISINDNQYIKNNQLIKILNEDYLLDLIEQVPLISSNKKSEITLEFPTPNNDLIQFEIYESPVMPINLSKKYPSIKTYTGRGIKNPNDRVSITKSNRGFQILILTNNERIFIQKINQSENNYSISYNENINDRLNIENQCSINGCSDVIIRNESDNKDYIKKSQQAVRWIKNDGIVIQNHQLTLLENWIANRGFKTIGMAKAAGYNPPFTLPFLRRNEVFIPIKRP